MMASHPVVRLSAAVLVAGLIGGTGAIVAFYTITQRLILRPIRQLRALANNVAEGNLEIRSSIATRDEYERLAGHKVKQIEYFEVVASFRRLFSIVVSISRGAEKLGMRPEAVMKMKENVDHIGNVYAFMCDRTGIAISEIEELISTLSEN